MVYKKEVFNRKIDFVSDYLLLLKVAWQACLWEMIILHLWLLRVESGLNYFRADSRVKCCCVDLAHDLVSTE